MKWKTAVGIKPGEDWRDCFAWLPKKVGASDWIWLEGYQERLVASRWIPGGYGAAFDFERRYSDSTFLVTLYSG